MKTIISNLTLHYHSCWFLWTVLICNRQLMIKLPYLDRCYGWGQVVKPESQTIFSSDLYMGYEVRQKHWVWSLLLKCFGFVFHSVLLFFSHLYLVPPAWLLGWQGVHANVFPLKSALVGMTNESWPSYCLSKPCMSYLQHNQPFKSRGLCDQVFLWTFGFSLEAQSFVMVLQ